MKTFFSFFSSCGRAGFSVSALVFVMVNLSGGGTHAAVLGPGFTYQGRLDQNQQPANGTADMIFSIWTHPTDVQSRSRVGTEQVITNVVVEEGLFEVLLNDGAQFGANPFNGDQLWLHISLRMPAGSGAYAVLTPRQPLAATPYAHTATMVPNGAVTSEMLANGAVTPEKLEGETRLTIEELDSGLDVNAEGFVGIGTVEPAAGLHVSRTNSFPSFQALAQVFNGTMGYTNLSQVQHLDIDGDLLVLGGGTRGKLVMVNIADPSNPVLLSQWNAANSGNLNDVDLSGTNLVATAAGQVFFYDVSNPAAPQEVAVLQDGDGDFQALSGAWGVLIEGDRLYVAGRADHALNIIDISELSNPQLVRSIVHGASGFNNMELPSLLRKSGSHLVIGCRTSVVLADISNPDLPVWRSDILNGDEDFYNQIFVVTLDVSGDLLALGSTHSESVVLVDISNSAAPTAHSAIENIEEVFGRGINSLAISGNQLFVTDDDKHSLTIFDISDVVNPTAVGRVVNGSDGVQSMLAPGEMGLMGQRVVVLGESSQSFCILEPEEKAVGLYSEGWVGIGTPLPVAALNVMGDLFIEQATDVTFDANRFSALGGRATGNSAFALGALSVADGSGAVAMGSRTTASGAGALALGTATEATGNQSLASGNSSVASGLASTAMGFLSKARGTASFAVGDGSVADGYSAAAFGNGSRASGESAFAAGNATEAEGAYSFVMGDESSARGECSFAVGRLNSSMGDYSVAMGRGNVASGLFSVALGDLNGAQGDYAMAAGRQARADFNGSFVWADSRGDVFEATATNQFLIRAEGGVGINKNDPSAALDVEGRILANAMDIDEVSGSARLKLHVGNSWSAYVRQSASSVMTFENGNQPRMAILSNGRVGIGTTSPSQRLHVNGNIFASGTITPNSDRTKKTDVAAIDAEDVLARVEKLPISQWRFQEEEEGIRHIGPMAQDFYAAFGLGENKTAIATVDADGVALAAIKGLNQKVDSEVARLRQENAELKVRLARLEALILKGK